MAKVKEEVMAIADLYAEALLASAPDEEQQRELAVELDALVGYMDRDRAFADFLEAATLDVEARRASLERLFRGRMHELLLNLLQVLNRRRRTGLVRMVRRCVELRLEEQREQLEVSVQSAIPLWHELRSAIERVMSLWLGKSAILVEEVKPDLIGGIVIKVGDLRIDGSVKSRIEGVRAKLRERMSRELHEGSARYATDLVT